MPASKKAAAEPSRRSRKATGEASGERGATGRSTADVPTGDGGVAAASTPPSQLPVFKGVFDSRVGFCLHYEQDGKLVRENLTVEKCDERIAALHASPTAVALWEWKKEQIEKHPPT